MEKYQKMIIGGLIAAASIIFIYVIVVYSGILSNGPDSDDSLFPFFIFFPSWVAIFVPIIARQAQEEKRKEEEEGMKKAEAIKSKEEGKENQGKTEGGGQDSRGTYNRIPWEGGSMLDSNLPEMPR